MTKRRRDQQTSKTPVTPLFALLVLLLANGQTLTVTIQPVCASQAAEEDVHRLVGASHAYRLLPLAEHAVPVGPVLVVDDNPTIRGMLVDVLHAAGYPVIEAADGQEALDLATISHPSVILLDLNVPVVSGFSFVAASKAQGIIAPILLVTSDPRAGQVALDEQVVGYLAKPFDLDVLVSTVAELVGERASFGSAHRP